MKIYVIMLIMPHVIMIIMPHVIMIIILGFFLKCDSLNSELFNFYSLFSLMYIVRYHSLAPMYYRGAQAAIVVYDITNQVI